MEDIKWSYNHVDEIIGMDIHMGNDDRNSNVHGEGKEENELGRDH
jgi:hypothetical protein